MKMAVKKNILLLTVLAVLISLCLVFTSCDSGSSDSSDAPVMYTVTFDLNGVVGTAPITQYIFKDGKVVEPKDPTAGDNNFAGWYKEKKCMNAWDFGTDTVTADITLYAKWLKGVLSGTFSVSASEKVHFSKGNLQATYNGSGYDWSFAANQYAYIGNSSGNKTIKNQSNGNVVDLFGWSTDAICNNWEKRR